MQLKYSTNELKLVKKILHELYIKETLSIYKPEFIYLISAEWTGEELTGVFKLEHYPFTKEEHLDYVTASMYMLYLSQIGYVLIRILCEENRIPLPLEEFFYLRDIGNILFIGFDSLKFKEKVLIARKYLKLRIRIKRMKALGKGIIGQIAFNAEEKFIGNAKVIILFDKNTK